MCLVIPPGEIFVNATPGEPTDRAAGFPLFAPYIGTRGVREPREKPGSTERVKNQQVLESSNVG